MKKKLLSFLGLSILIVYLFLASASHVNACQNNCLIDAGPPAIYECTASMGCGDCTGCLDNPYSGLNSKIRNTALPDMWGGISGTSFLQKFFNVFISLVFAVGGIIFFFMLITGGIKWIGSSGEKGKLEEAQKQITSALVGLVILLLAFAIIKLIESLFGISILNITIPTLQ